MAITVIFTRRPRPGDLYHMPTSPSQNSCHAPFFLYPSLFVFVYPPPHFPLFFCFARPAPVPMDTNCALCIVHI